MGFKNTITKIGYYFLMVSFIAIGILLFFSYFYIPGLTTDEILSILFFGSFFMQIGIGFIVVLLYYSLVKSKKNKIIHWTHIIYIGCVLPFFSILLIEWFILLLIVNEFKLVDLWWLIIGGLILFCFMYIYYFLKKHPNLHMWEKKPLPWENV